MKKIIANAPSCVLLCTATAYKEQTSEQLFTYKDISSVAKKITEDILHKIYTKEVAMTGRRLALSTVEARKEFTGFQVATS